MDASPASPNSPSSYPEPQPKHEGQHAIPPVGFASVPLKGPLAALMGLAFWAALATTGCSLIGVNRSITGVKYDALGVKAKQAELSSGTLRYRIGGQGFPVLLVHGFGFGALETWTEQVGPLVQTYRVIAPDLYWLGQSRPKVMVDTAVAQADALLELLDKLGVGKVHLVGLSYGGYVAMSFARKYPTRVGKLVLVDAAGLRPTKEEMERTSKNFGTTNPAEVLIPRDAEGLEKTLHKLFYKKRWIPEFFLKELLKNEMWRAAEQKRQILARMMSPKGMLTPKQLASIHHRTLLLWGAHDPLILPQTAQRMQRLLPRSKLLLFAKSAHAPMLEQPQRFNTELMRFLNSLP